MGSDAIAQGEVFDLALGFFGPGEFFAGGHALHEAGGGIHAHIAQVDDDIVMVGVGPILTVQASHPFFAFMIDFLNVHEGLVAGDAEVSGGGAYAVGQGGDEADAQDAWQAAE